EESTEGAAGCELTWARNTGPEDMMMRLPAANPATIKARFIPYPSTRETFGLSVLPVHAHPCVTRELPTKPRTAPHRTCATRARGFHPHFSSDRCGRSVDFLNLGPLRIGRCTGFKPDIYR